LTRFARLAFALADLVHCHWMSKMYRDNIAPDPGSLPADTAGAAQEPEFLNVSAGPRKAVLARKGR
jgi:hypothetical protein